MKEIIYVDACRIMSITQTQLDFDLFLFWLFDRYRRNNVQYAFEYFVRAR